jgi:hypothetical protein
MFKTLVGVLDRGRLRGGVRGVAALTGLLICAAVVWHSSKVAAVAKAESADAAWESGAVTLDAEPGAATFAARAGDDSLGGGLRCIEVTYEGEAPAEDVRLYTEAKAETDGGGDGAVLDTRLAVRVRIGDADDTCANPKKATWTDLTPTGRGESLTALAGYSGPDDSLSTGWAPANPGEKRAFLFAHAFTPGAYASDARGDEVSLDFVWAAQAPEEAWGQ